MRILIDDLRDYLPDGSQPDVILRNYRAAIDFCVNYWFSEGKDLDRPADELYVDHDLGDSKTGYDLMCELEEGAHHGMELPGKIVCVSDNPPGRYRIQQVIDRLYRQ